MLLEVAELLVVATSVVGISVLIVLVTLAGLVAGLLLGVATEVFLRSCRGVRRVIILLLLFPTLLAAATLHLIGRHLGFVPTLLTRLVLRLLLVITVFSAIVTG